MIVANDVSMKDSGFDVDNNKVTIITKNSFKEYEILSKQEVANNILDEILKIKR